MKTNIHVQATTRTPRRITGRSKIFIASGLALAGVFASAVPAEANTPTNFGSLSCNYGYYIALHSDGANFVQHTMRQTGSDSSTNKFKTWQNGLLGEVRVWGYGYQSASFNQVYTGSYWISSKTQTWSCN